ncbi:hypothetical protein [Pseudomonas kielensis]|jgi:hypothetical protein|uniref:Uncharacterized protein n=1 Tax=Pseudomonas kielensis TaxID=2762577 RepID=A0A7X1GD59_9PSED|nr:hypothetical protein [Pseudomonas kielensis]MBC2690216.1 hypothetical protein [Pseudomonas kielensis]
MVPRFVVVPAIPAQTQSLRGGKRSYCKASASGFNLYDNQDKLRLQQAYPSRLEAEAACQQLNAERVCPLTLVPLNGDKGCPPNA